MVRTEQMNNDAQTAKSALRSRVRLALANFSEAERRTASLQLRALIEKQDIWINAKSILFFAPLPDEPDVWPLLEDSLKAGKAVLLPRFDAEQKAYVACHIRYAARDVRLGKFGIREPLETCERISLNRLDLILVPGLAFDMDGHRLGRGLGFYDRLLAVLHGPTCGVAFDQQIVRQIPVEPHDMCLSCILTPTRWHCETDSARF